MTIFQPRPLESFPSIPVNAPLQDPQVAAALTGICSRLSAWSARVATLINSFMKGQIPGTETNDTATTGNVGEFVSAAVGFGAAVVITATSTPQDVASIALSAGDWDIGGNFYSPLNGSTATTCYGWASTTSATLPDRRRIAGSTYNGADLAHVVPGDRFSLSVAGTIYLSVQAAFTVGNPKICGFVWARRRR